MCITFPSRTREFAEAPRVQRHLIDKALKLYSPSTIESTTIRSLEVIRPDTQPATENLVNSRADATEVDGILTPEVEVAEISTVGVAEILTSATPPTKEETDLSLPTENAERQRDNRNKLKEEMRSAGMTLGESKKAQHRKKFEQQQDFDDCGLDTPPLEEEKHRRPRAMQRDNVNAIVEYAFYEASHDEPSGAQDDCPDDFVPFEELVKTLYLHREKSGTESVDSPDANPGNLARIHADNLDAFVAAPKHSGTVDILEVFGGEGGVGH